MMIENRENLGWCKPLSFLGGRVVVVLNERQVTCASVDGKTLPECPETTRTVAKLVNPEYDDYISCSDTEVLLDAAHKELPCCKCPWFYDCDAMDDEDEDEDEGGEEE